jgi:S1-C subfamily serine protease
MTTRSPLATLLSGVIGGLLVLVIGAVLIATDVIDTGDTTTVVRESPSTQPAATTATGTAGRTVREIYKQEGRGVVFIQSQGVTTDSNSPFGGPQQGTATGSGFVVDKDGTIVTNAHVVEGADEVDVRFEENGDFVKADVKGVDTSTDIAVLKIDPSDVEDLTPVPLGDSSKVQVGDPVIAIGNPFGYSRTVTTGIVSGLQREIQAPNGFTIPDVIQTDASINPGNSGGPLLDANGRVIAINSQIATGGGQGSVGIGFAVPINTAKKLLPDLKAGEAIERAYLGVQMQDVTKQLAEDLNLASDQGALVVEVTADSPAEKAGLRGGRTDTGQGVPAGGDLIVAVDGKPVRDSNAVANAISRKQPGDEAEITYYRGDTKKTVKVELTKRPASADQPPADPGGGGGGGGDGDGLIP